MLNSVDYTVYKDVLIKNSNIAKSCSIGDDSVIINSTLEEFVEIDRRNYVHNSTLGKCTYTGWNTYIGMADIGAFCSISRNVDIGGGGTEAHNISAFTSFPDEKMIAKIMKKPYAVSNIRVSVGSDVWIGQGVTILKKDGLRIGHGAVIGAGAVVIDDVPDYAIVAGIPAKIIRYRFDKEVIAKLLKIQWWTWSTNTIIDLWDLLHESITEEAMNILQERSLKERKKC